MFIHYTNPILQYVCSLKQKYLAAYTLLVLGGNATPSAADVTSVLSAAGAEVDDEKLSTLISELDGKDLQEVLSAGEKLISTVSFGGGGGGGGGGAAPAAAAGGAAAPAAEKEKPKVEEVDALDGGMDMFGGGGGKYHFQIHSNIFFTHTYYIATFL